MRDEGRGKEAQSTGRGGGCGSKRSWKNRGGSLSGLSSMAVRCPRKVGRHTDPTHQEKAGVNETRAGDEEEREQGGGGGG